MVYLRWNIVHINRVAVALGTVKAMTRAVVVVRVVATTIRVVVRVKGVKGADAAWQVRNFCQ